jgi:hypothetical protein
MTDWAALWSALAVPTEAVSARLHPESAVVWLGIGPSGRRHLLVSASGEEAGQHLLTTHGLNATTERLSIEGAAPDVWVDIVCLNEALNDTFAAVADDLVAETKNSPTDVIGGVRQVLRKWKWFWGVDSSGLSDEAALGIFGELWFLDRWAGLPGAVASWLGPTGSRHDFVSPSVSVEVKATRVRSDGPARHRITSLDQFADPESGDLYLFSLTVTPDANASNSLPAIVGLIRTRLHGHPDVLELFDQRLAEAGWTPAAAEKHSQTFRIRAEELYRVGSEFPRLTDQSFPAGLPAGVDNVTYTVDLATCVDHRSATTPEHAAVLIGALAI